MGEATPCTVRDGRFVEPCHSLAMSVHVGGLSKAKGVKEWSYSIDFKPSRRFFGVQTPAYPNGLSFNFCPWCGTDISAPFMPKEEPQS